jgi:ketose-bisphosphate aldolase
VTITGKPDRRAGHDSGSVADRLGTAALVDLAWRRHTAIPAFNIPYLPMMEPVVRALRDCRTMGLVMVARLEWVKFQAQSVAAIQAEYQRVRDDRFTRLHLDHVPVIDEDNSQVDYMAVIREAAQVGYESVMVDGSRLSLEENIAATAKVVTVGHGAGVPVEAELGAVMGHESGPLPPYEELFLSGKGFTDPAEAARFVKETGVDWLSVAIGNVHGAISKARKDDRKVEARLNIEHLARINEAVGVPLVLHGGTGIRKECILEGIKHGIAKINIATAIRQPYEQGVKTSVPHAQEAVYRTTVELLTNELEIAGTADSLVSAR